MTEIKILLTKETPEKVMRETASFINQIADTLYPKNELTLGEALKTINKPAFHPLDQAKVIPYVPEVAGPAPTPPVVPTQDVSYDPLSLDADGLPWDERIHSIGKVRAGDGRWRRRRNVMANTVAQVEAELRRKLSVVGATVPPAMLPKDATPKISVPPPPPLVAPVVEEVKTAPAETSSNGRSFDELMSLVTDIVVDGAMSEEDILTVVEQFSIKELADLAGATPETIGRVYVALEEAAK